MARTVSKYAHPLDNGTEEVELWFNQFKYHLVEENLVHTIVLVADSTNADKIAHAAMEKRIVSHFLTSITPAIFNVLSSLVAPQDVGEKTFNELKDTIVSYLSPRPTVLAERFKFHIMYQKAEESTQNFLARLRNTAVRCDFTDMGLRLRDQFIFGVNSVNAREALLEEDISNLTLESAFQKVITIERSRREAQTMSGGGSNSAANVNFVGKSRKPKTAPDINCEKCGLKGHRADKCNTKCYRCWKWGHIKSNCPETERRLGKQKVNRKIDNKARTQYSPTKRYAAANALEGLEIEDANGELYQLTSIEDFEFSESEDAHFVHVDLNTICLSKSKVKSDKPLINVKINGKVVDMEFDSGASVTVCSLSSWNAAGVEVELMHSNKKLRVANGEESAVLGRALVDVTVGGKRKNNLELLVTESEFPVLFGRTWIREFMGTDWLDKLCDLTSKPLVKSVSSIEETAKVQSGTKLRSVEELYNSPIFENSLGLIKDCEVQLTLKEGVKPVSLPCRRVAFGVKEKLEVRYKELVGQGILVPVKDSPWGTPVVPVLRDGKVRVCGDFTCTLNKALEVKHHPLPTVEECFSKVAGGQKFSKIDIRQAYNNLVIREEDQKLTTMNTHIGKFAWTRLPYGLNISGALFQESMDKILCNIPMTCCRVDDILCSGRTDEEHIANLNEVFSRLEKHGLKCRKDKTELFKESLTYLGHRISKEGTRPVMSKVEDLVKAPQPRNVKELISFLGAVGYYRKYLPNMSMVIEPLDKLRRKSVKWTWGKEQKLAYEKLKSMLCSEQVLTVFDPNLPVKIESDASSRGLGAVISHTFPDGSEKPVEFASRTLSQAEVKYSQIDKEALGIIWAVKRFHYYVYGGPRFQLVTDHQPLVHIFNRNKCLPEMSANRISRWALTLMNYDYEIRYRNTKDHANCDMLSRLPNQDNSVEQLVSDQNCEVFAVNMEETGLDAMLIAKKTKEDPLLSKVAMFVLDGWPEDGCVEGQFADKYECKSLWNRREQLTLEQGCVTWGDRVVIPCQLRKKVLSLLHATHIGRVGMKSLARSFVWWPRIDEDIDVLVKLCVACNKYGRNMPKVIEHPWIRATRPWQRIHVDFAGVFLAKFWLVVVDDYSKWPEVVCMNHNTTALATIRALRTIFARNGVPICLVSDQGPQFISGEFRQFMVQNGIRFIPCPTYSPKSNGLVERFIASFKSTMKKLAQESSDLEKNLANFLMMYRNTPHHTTGEAPAIRFLGRTLRSKMHRLRPSDRQQLENLQVEREEKLLASSKRDREFTVDEPVWVKANPSALWQAAIITKRYDKSPVYDVSFDGRIVKKHADSLKTRVKPIIELNKQNIPEAVKQQIRNSLEKQVTELSSSESQVQAPHSSSVPPITEISPQSDTQKSSCNEAQECMSDLPTPGIRRSNRLKLKPKPCYKT